MEQQYTFTKEVTLNQRNSQIQNVKTLLHELTHAKLHRVDNLNEYTRNEKEFQAELTAYTVLKYFGIDTEEYSINYMSEWTKNAELKDKIKLLNEVKETAREFIEVLENELVNNREYKNEKELSKESDSSFYKEKKVNYYDKDKLKDISIKEVCEQLGLELKRGSDNKLWTKIRDEKTGSCCINLDKNYWFDFGLGYGGDTIKLVEEVRQINSKEAMKELAEMFGIDGESVKNKFYLSKSDYELIGIISERATLNLDINLEKQSIDELKKIEKDYGKSMNDLANSDKEKFLRIIKDTSLNKVINEIAVFENNLGKMKNELNKLNKYDVEIFLYKKSLEKLENKIDKEIDILKKIGFKDECKDLKKYNSMLNEELKEYMKDTGLDNVFVEVKSSELKEIPKKTYKFKDINRELEIKEAIIRNKKEVEFFPSLKLKMNIENIESGKNFDVKFNVGDGKTNDLIEEIELLDNPNAKEFFKKFDKELKKIVHNKYEEEIIEKIEAHEEWIRSKGEKGECLDLSYKKLSGIEIVNKDLRGANFKGSEFENCVIYADLSNANLENVKVKETKFTGSKFAGTKLNTNTLDIIDTQIKEENIKHFIKENNLKTKEVKKMNLQFE